MILLPTVLKAKFTRRWRGKDGKWHYDYDKPKASTTAQEGLLEARKEYKRTQAAEKKFLSIAKAPVPDKKAWDKLPKRSWEQLGYKDYTLKMVKQKYGNVPDKKAVLYNLISEGFKKTKLSDYNLSTGEGWFKYYGAQYKALSTSVPNFPIAPKEYAAINQRFYEKTSGTAMDLWDIFLEKITKKWDRWAA